LNTKNPLPLVTIAISNLNSGYSIKNTLDSIICQDYKDVEIIVIDGGSVDESLDILLEYKKYIKYFVSECDLGISDAFNKAIKNSSGDYINFLGAGDCIINSNGISRMIYGIDKYSDMLISAGIYRTTNNLPIKIIGKYPSKFRDSFTKTKLLFSMSLPHQGLFTNRLFFEAYGLFDVNVKYSMDYEILLRAYRDFPRVILRNFYFASWVEGGIGTDKTFEILNEYTSIKLKNYVTYPWAIYLIHFYMKFKFITKYLLTKVFSL
jgi:glycosyltransferase involved in cell wall biosynthesis